jgi:hypothetical protein
LLSPFLPLPSWQTRLDPPTEDENEDEDEEDWNMTLNRYKSPGYYRVSLRDEMKSSFQTSKLQGPKGQDRCAKQMPRLGGNLFIFGAIILDNVCRGN